MLDGHRSFLIAEAIVWTAVCGAAQAASRAAQAARPTLPDGARSLTQKVATEAQCGQDWIVQ